MQPSISVVIPTFNRGALVRPTVDSALGQDLPSDEVEIILVDDGSTDDTFAVLQELYGENERVRMFSLANGGVAAARNFGLSQARGEFVAFLDHDDLWLPEKLRLQRDEMRANSKTTVVYGRWREADEAGREFERPPLLSEEEWRVLPQGDVFYALMHHNFLISATIPLVRTRQLLEVGGFDPAMVPCDDWDAWLKLSRLGPFAALEEFVAIYQRHGNQQSADEERMLLATQTVRLKHIRANPSAILRKPRVAWLAYAAPYFYRSRVPFYEHAREAIAVGDWKTVRRALFRGWRRFPLLLLTPQWLYILKRLVTRDARPF